MAEKWEDLEDDDQHDDSAEEARRHKEACARRKFRRVYNGERSNKSNRPVHTNKPSSL